MIGWFGILPTFWFFIVILLGILGRKDKSLLLECLKCRILSFKIKLTLIIIPFLMLPDFFVFAITFLCSRNWWKKPTNLWLIKIVLASFIKVNNNTSDRAVSICNESDQNLYAIIALQLQSMSTISIVYTN